MEEVYRDKVEEYMTLWRQLRELQEDIEERGVTVMDEKRGMLVENRSGPWPPGVQTDACNLHRPWAEAGGNSARRSGVDDDEL